VADIGVHKLFACMSVIVSAMLYLCVQLWCALCTAAAVLIKCGNCDAACGDSYTTIELQHMRTAYSAAAGATVMRPDSSNTVTTHSQTTLGDNSVLLMQNQYYSVADSHVVAVAVLT
jgi:hypothetical protein